jgi:hypothetical protein
MRSVIAAVLSTTCVCMDAGAAEDKKPILAVFNIEVQRAKLSEEAIVALSDYLATQIAETGLYQIVPRDELKKRLTEQKQESYKACYEESCQIELGKELAAQKSLATRVILLGSSCKVTLTLFDLRTGTSERAATETGGCTEDGVVSSIEKAVPKLVGSKSTPEPPPIASEPPKPEPKPEPRPEPAPKAAAPPQASPPPDEIEKLLNKAPGGEPPSSAGKGQLTREDIVLGLNPIRPRVFACAEQKGFKGSATFRIQISPSGSVSSVAAEAAAAGTSFGSCAEKAIAAARFKASDKGLTVRYPFVIR